MSTKYPEDREFEELLKDAPMGSEAPDELKSRLRAMAARRKPVRRFWMPRLAAVAGVAAAAIVATLLLWPAQASAKSFQKVVNAAHSANTFRLTIIQDNGNAKTHADVAVAGPVIDIRVDTGDRAQLNHGRFYVYSAKDNSLTVLKLGGLVDDKTIAMIIEEALGEALKQLNVKTYRIGGMLDDFKAQYGEQNAKISGIYSEDGRKVYSIDLRTPDHSSRTQITVDADTDLPKRIKVGDGNTTTDMKLEFGTDIRIEPLEDSVPKDAKRMEFDLSNAMSQAMTMGAQALGQRLSGDDKDGKGMESPKSGLQGLKFNGLKIEGPSK